MANEAFKYALTDFPNGYDCNSFRIEAKEALGSDFVTSLRQGDVVGVYVTNDLEKSRVDQVVADSTGQACAANSYAVAGLPALPDGSTAYAVDGRKPGDGPGAGTGAAVYRSAGQWLRASDDSVVAA